MGEVVNVERLRTGKESFYLLLIVIASIGVWGWLVYSVYQQFSAPAQVGFDVDGSGNVVDEVRGSFSKIGEALSTPVILLLVFVFGLFFHLLAMAHIRMNSIKVGSEQFPELYEAVGRLSARLGLKKQPDMFVMLGHGVLNAFAARLVFRKLLVIYSELAEALIEGQDKEQLEAVVGHELGHHAFGHTSVWMWLLEPGMAIPSLSTAYSRAREYSCDRVMKALVRDETTCERALIKLAAGKHLGQRANIDKFVDQAQEERGFFAWLAEILSTHPHLPKRIAALRKFEI